MSRVQMSKEREQSLRQLAKLMNTRHRLKFPITRPLLECFDVAVTPEAAQFLLRMGTEQHTYEEAASMSDLGEDAFRAFFDAQVRKGLLWPAVGVDGKERYYVPGIMVGWFEVFLSDGQETAEQRGHQKRNQIDALHVGQRHAFFFSQTGPVLLLQDPFEHAANSRGCRRRLRQCRRREPPRQPPAARRFGIAQRRRWHTQPTLNL